MTDRTPGGRPADGPTPAGGVYEWYVNGLRLLEAGSPAAAAQLLTRALAEEPGSRSLAEALGRAQFDARMYDAAAATFTGLVEADPADHYARFGLGLALSRLGRHDSAVEHLALATAMRPDLHHYETALRGARATVRARRASA